MSSRDDDPGMGPPRENLQDRLRSLEERLDARKGKERVKADGSNVDKSGFGKALRMSSEFISAILVGAGLGFFLDRFAGTSPWGMIVLLLLGFVAGVINVLRSSGQIANPYEKGWASSEDGTGSSRRQAPNDLYDDEDED